MAIYLHYCGDGSALPGLPARDISKSEFESSGYELDVVLASGLYEQADVRAAAQGRKEK